MAALLAACLEPAHVAVIAGLQKVGERVPGLRTERGVGEADGVEAQIQRLVADQAPWAVGHDGEGAGPVHVASSGG